MEIARLVFLFLIFISNHPLIIEIVYYGLLIELKAFHLDF